MPNTLGISTFLKVGMESDPPRFHWRVRNMPRIPRGTGRDRPLDSIWATLKDTLWEETETA